MHTHTKSTHTKHTHTHTHTNTHKAHKAHTHTHTQSTQSTRVNINRNASRAELQRCDKLFVCMSLCKLGNPNLFAHYVQYFFILLCLWLECVCTCLCEVVRIQITSHDTLRHDTRHTITNVFQAGTETRMSAHELKQQANGAGKLVLRFACRSHRGIIAQSNYVSVCV
jgi:hypothetical protein